MPTIVRADLVVTQVVHSHPIDLPVEAIDIATWLLTLPNAEYQRCCPPDHIACGRSVTEDGRPMVVAVEKVGGRLVVQQYVGEIMRPDRCRMISTSDLYDVCGLSGRSSVQVIYEMSVHARGDGSCEYVNSLTAHPTEELMEFLDERAMTFEEIVRERHPAVDDHARRETPLVAESLARAARARPWARLA